MIGESKFFNNHEKEGIDWIGEENSWSGETNTLYLD